MSWKIEYLSNLMKLVDCDQIETNREFLALIEIEKRIGARIDEYVEAKAGDLADGMRSQANPIVGRNNLKHLFLVAYIDGELSRAEEKLIREYVASSQIDENVVENVRKEAQEEARRLVEESIKRQFGGG